MICPECKGSRLDPVTSNGGNWHPCVVCDGIGRVSVPRRSPRYRRRALRALRGRSENPLVLARYVGRDPKLRGERALVRRPGAGEPEGLMVQFNDMDKLPRLAHGWHHFRLQDFKLQSH